MNRETKTLFEKLFGKKNDSEINIVNELNKVTKPVGGFLQQKKSYKELLESIAKKENISTSNLSVNEIEELIMIKRFNENFESLSDEEKQTFQAELNKELERQGLDSSQIKSLSTIGALTAASASGFSMYIMASTIVGGVTGILGITLPFAFYTGMSSVLSVITGPIGWTVGLGYLVYKFKDESLESASEKFINAWKSAKSFISGDFERASIIVSIICSIRILNNEKVNLKIKNINEKISTLEIEKDTLINDITIKDNCIKDKENQIKQLKSELNNELEIKQKIENSLNVVSENINILKTEILNLEQEII
ncbi:MAG: hypothetical protein Q4G16_07365 [Cruoricaptor ignavus]|nr:hypothetical protein [Cruoricaptor ignavus]